MNNKFHKTNLGVAIGLMVTVIGSVFTGFLVPATLASFASLAYLSWKKHTMNNNYVRFSVEDLMESIFYDENDQKNINNIIALVGLTALTALSALTGFIPSIAMVAAIGVFNLYSVFQNRQIFMYKEHNPRTDLISPQLIALNAFNAITSLKEHEECDPTQCQNGAPFACCGLDIVRSAFSNINNAELIVATWNETHYDNPIQLAT